jgi:hypothetical protein
MSNGRSVIRPVVFALCVGFTLAGLRNVYGDNADVVARAQTTACGSAECALNMTRMARTPFSQSFTFQVRLTSSKLPDNSATVDVECQRAYVLVGEYHCERHGELPASPGP